MRPREFRPPSASYFLFGARGTGKSSLVRQSYPDALYLDKALRYGLVPLINEAPDPGGALKAYVSLYVREEVFQEGLVRNVGGFSRFLEAMSYSHGQVLNLADIARESQVERKSIEGCVTILEDLLIAFRLPVFSRLAKRELIAQQLRAWLSYRQGDTSLSYWRTRGGTEVDFVLYGDLGLVSIEAKYSNRVRSEDLRALKAFKEDYPEAVCHLVYLGAERLLIDGILCLPSAELLPGLTTRQDSTPLP